jgi:hypothetical protein
MAVDYSAELKRNMIAFYESLSEKDKRRYAAIEAQKLGHGGIRYICELLGCDENTIRKGLVELPDTERMEQRRTRAAGGGRKSKLESIENIDEVFLGILQDHTAGDPMKEGVKWTQLSRAEIAGRMKKKGIAVSRNIIKKLFKKHGFVKRKALKKVATGQHPERNAQFEKIAGLREQYEKVGWPVLSIDTKKKEHLGNLYRAGKLECTQTIVVYDHDFPHLAEGIAIPYTIHDLQRNEAFAYIGTSHDTSDFACDAIKAWWHARGKHHYPNAPSILCLADGGGSNSSRTHVFKESLQKLVNAIGVPVRLAHYPPYTSKWNPIEHLVFPHITRSMQGVVLSSLELVQDLIQRTTTRTGLRVIARISKKLYETGKAVADDFYEHANITFDKALGAWNYVVSPN